MGAYQAATQRGLNIPRDLSIVGFDNQENIADVLQPPLTTAELPHYDMGYWGVNTLLDIVNTPSGTSTPQHAVLPCPLIRRASVGPPPGSHPERTADRRSLNPTERMPTGNSLLPRSDHRVRVHPVTSRSPIDWLRR